MKTPITTRQAFARLCEFKYQIAAIGIGLAVGFCAPPPAHAEPRDPYRQVPARDPYYTRYPFQTPSQIGRQLHDEAAERRREDRYEQERRAERSYEELQRQIEEIYRGR